MSFIISGTTNMETCDGPEASWFLVSDDQRRDDIHSSSDQLFVVSSELMLMFELSEIKDGNLWRRFSADLTQTL